MQALAELLAKERQRLPIDVPQAERATIGGVIATNWNGPRRFGEGTRPRLCDRHQRRRWPRAAVQGRRPRRQKRRRLRLLQAAHRLAGHAGRDHAGDAAAEADSGAIGAGGLRGADAAAAEKLLAALVTSKTTPTAIELLAGPAWQSDPALAGLDALVANRRCIWSLAWKARGRKSNS